MTTWTNARCSAAGPDGEACVLPAGHAGDHASGPSATRQARPKSRASTARLATTPLAVLLVGLLLGLLLGPLYLWIAGAAVIAIVYLLVASR